jgi:hypothetical protein
MHKLIGNDRSPPNTSPLIAWRRYVAVIELSSDREGRAGALASPGELPMPFMPLAPGCGAAEKRPLRVGA